MIQTEAGIQYGQSFSYPVPIGGWNARDDIRAMDPRDAIRLENAFPDVGTVRLRNGFRVHASGMGSGAVETLVEHVTAANARKLVAGANGNLYDCTTLSGAPSSLGSGYTSDRWQTVVIGGVTLFFNGADTPQQYNGSAVSNATYTGIGTPANLISPTIYREALFVVEKDSTSVWYGAAGSITGALTEYDLGYYLNRGGYIVACGTLTIGSESAPNQYFVAVSSLGEVLIYAGTLPSATWSLVARTVLPAPLGRRCLVEYGAELLYICERGVMPLSQIITGGNTDGEQFRMLTTKIDGAFTLAAKEYGTTFGWEGINYPRGKYLCINVPIVGNTTTHQYIMNTITGAWCKFIGQNANCWALHNEKLYFGGTDGKVYQADFGDDDNSNSIDVDIKTAFSYLGDPNQQKLFTMGRPVVQSTGEIEFSFGVDLDFDDDPLTNTVSITGTGGTAWGSAWGSPWGNTSQFTKEWYSLTGVGRAAAIKMAGSYKDVSWEISAFDIVHTRGGIA